MRRDLNQMVTVIAGASAGIGRALALELAERGGNLVLGARRLDRLTELGQQLGGKHVCMTMDVSRPEDCRRLVQTSVEKFGRIDTLVCNAGYGLARGLDSTSSKDVQDIFQTNVFGTIDCCRSAVEIMKRQEPRNGLRGQLMLVSSACARRGLPYFSLYAATKAAQLSLAEGLRVELKPFGIAVTSVHPELIDTDFFRTSHKVSGMDPAALAHGKKSSPQWCAAKMARAIEKPCRELWPKPFSRVALTIATIIPGVADFFIGRIRDRMLEQNGMLESDELTASVESREMTQSRPATP